MLAVVELNIASCCAAIADAHPDRDALVWRRRRRTWAETADRIARFAAVLAAAGLGRHRDRAELAGWMSGQDHVALYLHNRPEYLEAMVGSYAGACAPVNVNYRYTRAELAYLFNDSAARAVVFTSTFAPAMSEVLPILDHRPALLLQVPDDSGHPLLDGAIDFEEALAAAEPLDPASPSTPRSSRPDPDDLYICYTGGTTGAPKGVLWRQGDFVVSALGVRRRDGADFATLDELVATTAATRLRALPAPPLMHGAAHWNALSCWLAGGTVLIQDHTDHLDAADVLGTVARERATSLLIVGDSFARPLLEEIDRATDDGTPYDLTSLRYILSGGAILSAPIKERLVHIAGGPEGGPTVVDVLGSTESGRQAVSKRSGDSVGGGFTPSSTAALLTDDRRAVLPPGDTSVGWLTQTGRVPLGYLGDPAKTEATFPVIDGVRHAVAGDRARWRDDGAIELLGRESVCINTGGEKVFAEEIEVTLTSHPAVRDAVVCGRPSQRWGSEVVAVVELQPGRDVDTATLRDHCKQTLAPYKAPRDVVFVERVLRSPSGKADYRWAEALVRRDP
ncbi:MAG: AMP-binding protein [Microthrixaceae bacterium]